MEKVHILPGQGVSPNNVYKIHEKGYTTGNGLFYAFETLSQVPCTKTGLHKGEECIKVTA